MDINKILQGIECDCGKKHTCDIEYVFIENDAILRIKTLYPEYKSVLIVADENTYAAAGKKTENQLLSRKVEKVIFGGGSVLIPNEEAIARVREKLCGVDMIIGIGSGVIQDLCKYVSYYEKIPYMVIATAPSMDGYASDGAAMILKGMKETVAAGLPRAIIADTEVLKKAPLEMIKAGYGDIVGKYSALCDWKLSAEVNGEYFCQYIYDMTHKMIENTLSTAKGLLKRDEESVKALMEALTVVGIMMSFAGSSRPASGSEHHLSHFFEITGIVNNEPYFAHGIDVAYSTVVTSQIREKLLKEDFANTLYRLPESEYKEKMQDIYKSVAEGCIELQKQIGNYNKDRSGIYKEREGRIKEILSEPPGADEIKGILSLAELDISEFYDMYGEEKINNSVLYAKDLKDRYTVLWLNYDLFGGNKNED